MSNIIPFDPPHMFTARLKAGFVDVSTTAVDGDDDDDDDDGGAVDSVDNDGSSCNTNTYHRGWDNATAATYYPSTRTSINTDTNATSLTTIPVPLERTETTSGKIMEITVTSSSRPPVVVAFWLLRKLGHHPIVRLGYKLRLSSKNNNNSDDQNQNQNLRWELDTDELGRLTLLRIHIFHCSILNDDEKIMPEEDNNTHDDDDDDDAGVVVNSCLNELSALQLIAKQTQKQQQQHENNSSSCSSIFPQKTKAHVVGTDLIATTTTTTTASDEENNYIYAVLPYYRDGTLLQFCQSIGSPLDESLARYIFRQIIQGLKTLKSTGLCHRNLSLDAIAMDGDHFDIIGLGWTLRVTDSNSSSRVMVMAAGLMLYSMVVGTNALFSAPIAGDKIFTRLCIKGDIRGEVERYGKQLGQDYYNLLSNELLDLLRTMLRADPKQRLSLEEVMDHPWVTNDDLIITPTQWMEKKKKSII